MSRSGVARPVAAALAACLAAGVAGAQEPPDAACLERAPVARYLTRTQDRILEAWKLPSDGLADREVVIQLKIAEDGMLLGYEVVSFTDRRLAKSVKVAVMLASPFEPIPPDARCVVGRPIQTTFRNPP